MKIIKPLLLSLALCMSPLLPGTWGTLMAQSCYHSIKSSGSNWICTDYVPNSNTKVILTFNFYDIVDCAGDVTGNALFGSGDTSDAGSFWLTQDKDGYGHTQLRYRAGTKVKTLTWDMSSCDDGAALRYRVTMDNGSLLLEKSTDNGVTFTRVQSTSWTPDPVFKSTLPMYLGAVNGSSDLWGHDNSFIRVFEMVIEENNQIKRHYYPAATGENIYGYLYDKLSNSINKNWYFINGQHVSKTACAHKFVEYNASGLFKCCICGKRDIQMNEWADSNDDARGVTTVEPFLNFSDLSIDSCVQQTLIVTGAGNIGDTYVVDSASNAIIVSSSTGNDASKQLELPNCDKRRTLYVLGYVRTAEDYNDAGTMLADSLYTFSSVKITQLPLHYPHDLTVTQEPGIQPDGTCQPYNVISWRIQDPDLLSGTVTGTDGAASDTVMVGESSDLMPEDHFMIYRAFENDYSDEALLDGASASLSEFTKRKDGYGYYALRDETPEGQYNSDKKSRLLPREDTAQPKALTEFLANSSLTSQEKLAIKEFYKGQVPVYYRVTRALVNGIWGEAAKNFSLKKTLYLHNMLPSVTSVKVEKTSNWSSDKKVELKLQLANPYVWQFSSKMDSAKVHRLTPDTLRYRRYVWDTNTNIKVTRFCPETEYDTTHSPAVDAAAETITIKGSDVKWDEKAGCYTATVEDVQSLPYTHFYYTAELDTTNSIYPTAGDVKPYTTSEEEANACYSETVASVSDFAATQGISCGQVDMTWTLGLASTSLGESTLQITRREYKGLNESGTKVEYGEEKQVILDNTSTGYIDNDVLPGHVYEYLLTSVFKFRGKPYTSETKTLGWPSHVGIISGKVLMPNGTAVKGATVLISSQNAIDIPEVKDETGKVLVPAVKESSYQNEIVTNDKGEFSDSVNFCAEGTQYNVAVNYCTTFTWNGNTSADITLDRKKWDYTEINMVSSEAYKFSGNVLYENSTIPVRNAMFELIHYDANDNVTQRELLRDSHGDYIKSDQMGGFSISLLPIKCSLRVVKDGHTMKDDGMVKIGDKQDDVFTPQKQQDGIRIWDATKVRMVGRVVGGNIQGSLPLGKGLSRNNLGDSLTVVMQLDGDNTSKIVYQQNDPDNTTIKDSVDHQIYDANGNNLGYKTAVTFERKRIVIKPDPVTGEFFVDIAPARYKVTQLSAQGYATLYQDGQGFDVLDYVDSIGTVYYNRIYHVPATVTYKQYTYGRQTAYIGEKSIRKKNLLNNTVTMEVAGEVKDAETNTYTPYYTFNHPVFQAGNSYLMKVQAHEDYYYNNDTQAGKIDVVNLDGGKLHVRNGMIKDNADSTYVLGTDGTAMIYVSADTPDFTNTGEKALHTISMQVEYKDYFYDAQPLEAYILGEKYMGADILPIGSNLRVIDIIRDPYGSQSYAYREKGTTYHWESDGISSTQWDFAISGAVGPAWKNAYGGIGISTIWEYSATLSGNLNIPFYTSNTKKSKGYDMTLNERICTSDDPLDVGANADVYVGVEETYAVTENQAITVIDQATYDVVKPSVDNGNTTIITEGQSQSGEKYYVVRGMEYAFGTSKISTFAYTQKHILGTIIPQLEKKYNDLLSTGDSATLQAAANADGKPRYWYDSTAVKVVMLIPENSTRAYANMADSIYNAIKQWEEFIGENEGRKLDIMSTTPYKSYSVASTEVDYSEEASGYSQTFNFSPSRSVTGGFSIGGGGKDTGKYQETTVNRDDPENPRLQTSDPQERAIGFKITGLSWSLSFGPKYNVSTSGNREYYKISSAGYGFVVKGNDNGYMNMDVYRDATGTDISISTDAQDAVAADIDVSSDKSGSAVTDDAKSSVSGLHNFIYVLRGGATRQPWYPADTTVYCKTGSLLGTNTLKIDNPKIYIASPVISNQPEDEPATFQLQLTNETEYTGDNTYLNPSTFVLSVDESTNPNGAQLYMDGTPIGSGRSFVIAPGNSITKTLQVKKGVGYKFEDIKLIFRDNAASLIEKAAFSVNYLPMASKVTMTSPTDKWVMNTFSAYDDDGYYIPVSLGDFNVNSEGFHHIELQYKKQTDGDSQWVTFDSYYNDSTLYNAATGVRHMIDNGKIANVKFHGEKDPMEMKYDLRAVTFRELGTGFTTRASSVMSGTKDTRCPEIFGVPTPASGILTSEDVIQMNFTEPIAYNYLDKVSDFQVQGYTNESDISLSSSLRFNGNPEQMAVTSVERTLNQQPFTIDMLVKVDSKDRKMVLFSQGNENHSMAFATKDNKLMANIDGSYSYSEPLDNYGLDLSSDLTHVGMMYNPAMGIVKFFAGGSIISSARTTFVDTPYSASGPIYLGQSIDPEEREKYSFSGNMLEVRLWGEELSNNMIAKYNKKRLSGYENQLIAHWPMTETSGSIVKDDAHGANITISGGIEWDNVDGYSLFTRNAPVELNPELISCSSDNDYTLTFWFKVDSLQTDSAALFDVGSRQSGDVAKGRLFVGFKNTDMVVVSNGNTYVLGKASDYADQNWHHFAMTVNRGRDQFITYLDGKIVKDEKADGIDGLSSSYAALGSKYMWAHFDVFTRWEQALPKYIVQEEYNTRFTGKEMGLKAYLPFYTRVQSDQGTMYNATCILNRTMSKDENNIWKYSTVQMVTGGYDQEQNLDINSHAPIREMPELENLDFSWSSTGTALQVNLNRADKDINKQPVYITLRGVEDEHGNVMKSPQTMAFYVDKNILRWDSQTAKIECAEGESASTEISWKNSSGSRVSYTITGLPSWLHASYEQGNAEPEEENTLRLTTDAGLAAGSYTTILYLTDENSLSDLVTLTVTVKPTDTGWYVDKTKYDRTMNLCAEVKTKNCYDHYVLDADPEDLVGAFISNQCVGVANISDEDGRLYMTIYADTLFAQKKRNIQFRLWNHETGDISELLYVLREEPSMIYGQVQFQTNSTVGLPPNDPITLVTSEKKIQTIYFNEGWNWASFYLQPDAVEGVNSVFINQKEMFSDGDIIRHVDFAQYSEKTLDWMGYLTSTDYHNVYQIFVKNAGNYRLMGMELPSDSLVVPVKAGWNDVPYLLSAATTIDNALADFLVSEKAHTGDIIKSMDQFAVADSRNGKMEWVGTLNYMQPGKGYYLYHTGDSVSFKYQTNVLTSTSSAKTTLSSLGSNLSSLDSKTASGSVLSSSSPEFESADNMPVIATLAEGTETQQGDTVIAIADGKVVGAAPVRTTMFISVNAFNGNAVTFGLCRGGELINTTLKPVTYNADAVVGSLGKPYVIDFSADAATMDDNADSYDLSGRKVTRAQPQGIYITRGKKIAK